MIPKRDAMRAVLPLKRRFGMHRDQVELYAVEVGGHDLANLPSLAAAVTDALAMGTLPAPHELTGLMLAARRAYAEEQAKGRAGVREGAFVAGRDCHDCGGPVEYRASMLWCPSCNAVSQVGETETGKARYGLTNVEASQLTAGPAHEWPETPEEARERVRVMARTLSRSMDLNAAIAD